MRPGLLGCRRRRARCRPRSRQRLESHARAAPGSSPPVTCWVESSIELGERRPSFARLKHRSEWRALPKRLPPSTSRTAPAIRSSGQSASISRHASNQGRDDANAGLASQRSTSSRHCCRCAGRSRSFSIATRCRCKWRSSERRAGKAILIPYSDSPATTIDGGAVAGSWRGRGSFGTLAGDPNWRR